MRILYYIGFAVVGALIIYLLVKAIAEGIEHYRFWRKNHDAQFSGSAKTRSKRKSYEESIGDYGEKRVSSYLGELPCEEYQVFNDLLIRNGKYTTQIDHIIISRYGVFVLETKNIHGKVYGSENAEFWKQYLPDTGYRRYGTTQEHELRNPIWQNDGHIKSLRRLVFGDDVPIHGIVVFPGDTDVNVTANKPVLSRWELVSYIKGFHNVVMSAEQMNGFRRRLLEVISTDEADREHHLDNVGRSKARRDEAVANGKCPRCGGNLVLRNGKYGQFYGCSNYPKCNYILNR